VKKDSPNKDSPKKNKPHVEVFRQMRAIKKIIALATGATMLGATIMGAMAADLADFPSPLLIKDTTFDADIVYGTDADPSDIMGLVDAIAEISVIETEESVSVGTTVAASGEATKIEKPSDKLNLGEDISNIQSTKLDSGDLPMVLADGTYTNDENKEFDYEQKLDIGSQTFGLFADRSYEDNEPTIGLHVEAGTTLLTYSLEFTTDAESDVGTDGILPDFEDTVITIMGKDYDIVEATNASGGYFELMGGAIKDVLEQGQVKTYTLNGKDYEVEVTYIGGTTDSQVKFKINGEVTDVMEVGETDKLADGTEIGVREILEEEAGEVTADQVEFYLGAQKLTLENGKDMELADEDVDDVDVILSSSQSGTDYTLSSIDLAWTPEDEIFVTEEESPILPGLETMKVSYEGLSVPGEEIIEIADSDEDTIELSVPIKGSDNGWSFDLIVDVDGGGFDRLGNIDYTLLAPAASPITYDEDLNDYFIVSNTNSYETHFVEVTNIDTDEGVDFKDAVTDSEWTKKDVGETFDVGDVAITVESFNKTANEVVINTTDVNFAGDVIYTEEGLMITIAAVGANTISYNLTFEEEADDSGVAGATFSVELQADLPTIDANVQGTNLTGGQEIGDTDEYLFYEQSGEVGTKLIHDRGPDQPTATITYPGGESYGNLFISETGATFASSIGGTAMVLKKVTIPLAKSDDEALSADSTMTKKNYLLVGGPCANKATAKVLGSSTSWPGCADGFEEGVGRVVLKEMGNKVSMVIAGYSAVDTTRATRVLKNYKDYTLSGDEVEVLGTTATPQTVRAVTG
jgi:hypothetical protein